MISVTKSLARDKRMKIEQSEMQRPKPLHQLLFLWEFGKNTGHVFAVIFHMELCGKFPAVEHW